MSPARNLGVMFDLDLNFRQHISQIWRACFYHVRDLRHIHRHRSRNEKTSVVALIGRRPF